MRRKTSLTKQIVQILVLFVVITVMLVSTSQGLLVKRIYKSNKINSMKETAESVAININNRNLDEFIRTLTLEEDVCIMVVTGVESVTINSRRNACVLSNLTLSEVSDIAYKVQDSGGSKLFENYQLANSDRNDFYIYGTLTSSHYNSDILVLVSSVVTPVNVVSKTFSSQVFFVVLVIILMSMAMGVIISQMVLKPINQLKSESKLLPFGQYKGDKFHTDIKELSEFNDVLTAANSEILKAEKAKKELIGNVSHDLKTPLTMIVGYGEMIRDLPGEDNAENAQVIINEAQRLTSLVNDLLDFSKVDEIKLNREEVSLNNMLKDVYNQYLNYFRSNKVKFELKLVEDKEICVDFKRIKQVLYNFLNNAYNYNESANKQITLGVEKTDDKYRVYVLDNGIGIREEDQDKIWDRYYKVDKEHKRSAIGSGIGLSLAKNILEQHGLKYGVDSVYGEYSKFWFEII